MSDDRRQAFDDEVERLQGLLTALEGLSDPAAKSAARELVQVVIGLHGTALSDLLGIVQEAGTQPSDTLLPRFAANPTVRGMLLLHDLHPEDMETRARQAVDRLRPHLGVRGVRAELVGVEDDVVRIRVSASGQKSRRPSVDEIREEVEHAVLELVPDASDLVIDGLDTTGGAQEAYVSLSEISVRRKPGSQASAAGE